MTTQKTIVNFSNIDDTNFIYLQIHNGKYKQFKLKIYKAEKEFIVFESGLIYQKMEFPDDKERGTLWFIKENYTTVERRFEFTAGGKVFNRAKFILHAFGKFDLDDKTKNVEFKTKNENNYHIKNLRLTDKVIIHPMLEKLKGCSWDKTRNKFRSDVRFDKKKKYIGHYDTEDEAHKKYLFVKMYTKMHNAFPDKKLIDDVN